MYESSQNSKRLHEASVILRAHIYGLTYEPYCYLMILLGECELITYLHVRTGKMQAPGICVP